MPDEDALFQRRDPSGRIPYLACKMGEGFAFKWRQPVVIGLHSSSSVVIDKGLSVGEKVSMTPFEFIGREDLPDAQPIEGEVAGEQEPVEEMDSQEESVTMKEQGRDPEESVPGS